MDKLALTEKFLRRVAHDQLMVRKTYEFDYASYAARIVPLIDNNEAEEEIAEILLEFANAISKNRVIFAFGAMHFAINFVTDMKALEQEAITEGD